MNAASCVTSFVEFLSASHNYVDKIGHNSFGNAQCFASKDHVETKTKTTPSSSRRKDEDVMMKMMMERPPRLTYT
jgi:hypothetical protein